MNTETLHDRGFALVKDSESASQPEGSQQDSTDYFLEVDPEHRYKTPEEAKEAITESSRRVEELTSLQENLKQYGIESPEDFDALVDQLLEAREKAGGTANLSDMDKAALEYLERLGVVTKGHLEAADREQRTAEIRQQEAGIVESARGDLGTLLKDAGLPATASQLAEVWMKEYLESQSVDGRGRIKPGSLLDKFWNGGESAKKVIQEVFAVWREGTSGMHGTTPQRSAKTGQ